MRNVRYTVNKNENRAEMGVDGNEIVFFSTAVL